MSVVELDTKHELTNLPNSKSTEHSENSSFSANYQPSCYQFIKHKDCCDNFIAVGTHLFSYLEKNLSGHGCDSTTQEQRDLGDFYACSTW